MTGAEDQEVLEYDGATGAPRAFHAANLGGGMDDVLGRAVPGGARQTLVPDIQGSVTALLDSGGALARVGYGTFGESAAAVASGAGPRYTARRLDPETAGGGTQPSGLYYYRARAYSPAWGRFLQPDPIGIAGGVNLYAYVGNDPLNATDPSGLVMDAVGGAASGAYNLLLRESVEGIQELGTRLYNDPAQTIASIANSFPATRLEGELASGLAVGATILQNAARGSQFEQAALRAIGTSKNTTAVYAPGVATRGSIPDALTTGVTEFKDALQVSNSLQLRIQAAYANLRGIPLNLVVSPTTQRVSQSLQQAVASTGGTVQRFNPLTGVFSPFP